MVATALCFLLENTDQEREESDNFLLPGDPCMS